MTTPNEELILKLRGQAYTTCRPDQLCDQAADLLQSQAERIAALEKLERALKEGLALACIERDTLRAQLADAELHTKQVERGLDKATAQLADIEKTEPVAWRWVWKSKPWDIEGWCYTNTPPNHPELQEIEKLFTRPMPAQGVAELVDALERLLESTTGVDQVSTVNEARKTLSKYKGAK